MCWCNIFVAAVSLCWLGFDLIVFSLFFLFGSSDGCFLAGFFKGFSLGRGDEEEGFLEAI